MDEQMPLKKASKDSTHRYKQRESASKDESALERNDSKGTTRFNADCADVPFEGIEGIEGTVFGFSGLRAIISISESLNYS